MAVDADRGPRLTFHAGWRSRPVNSRTGGLRLAVAWPGTGTAVSITDRGRTCVLPGDRQSPVRLIGEFTDPAHDPGRAHRDPDRAVLRPPAWGHRARRPAYAPCPGTRPSRRPVPAGRPGRPRGRAKGAPRRST